MDHFPRQTRIRGRRLLTTLFALAATAAALVPAGAGAAPVTARPADNFVDSIGVNTHLYYDDTDYYRQFGVVSQRLRELGVRHIRENLVPDRPDQYQRLNQLAAQGVKATLILGEPTDGAAGLAELTSILATKLNGSVAAIEGPNEWDLRGSSNWMSTLAPYQAQLWSQVKGNPALAGLPVVGPSLGNTNSRATDISGSLEYGNIHSYPNGEPPEWNLSSQLSTATAMSGSKPVMATETGYHNALGYSGGHRPASEAAQATYLPRLFLEYYRRGIVRTFSYELLDEFPDPSGAEPESRFGLLRNDLSPKPAFTALQNLIAICADPGGGAISPGKLDYAISGDQTELRQMLLQKSDGSFYLALWRAESVWDNKGVRALGAPSRTVKVSFPGGVAGAQEFAPNVSAQPLRTLPGGEALSVEVGSQVVILKLGGKASGGAQLGTIKVWVDERAVEKGDRVVVEGKMAGAASARKVKVQRWKRGAWRTVAKTSTRGDGRFKQRLRMLGGVGPSRIRVIADRAKPSNQVRVRVLARGGGKAVALGKARKAA